MKKQEETEKIERYLLGAMQAEEKQAFEEEVRRNADLRLALELQQDIHRGISYHFQSDLKGMLQREEGDMANPRQGRHPGQRRFLLALAVAASFVLLLLAGYWYIASQQTPTDLYYAHYQPYPNIINPLERSGAAPTDPMARAMLAYEQANYDVAISLFEQQAEQLTPAYKFYLALSLLEVGESSRTVALLEEVAASENESLFLPALWYRGLAHLKANRTDEAREVLNQLLEQDDSTYHPRAMEILEQL